MDRKNAMVRELEDMCLRRTAAGVVDEPQSVDGLKQFYVHCAAARTHNSTTSATASSAELEACGAAIRFFMKCALEGRLST